MITTKDQIMTTNELILTEAAAAQSEKTAEVMRRFNDAFLQHDPAALSELIAEDCVIEETVPAPSGAAEPVARHASSCGSASPPTARRGSTSSTSSSPAIAPPSAGATAGATRRATRCAAST